MQISDHITEILKLIWEDTSREWLRSTPSRVAKSYKKLFEGYWMNSEDFVTTFDWEKYDEMIICKDIEFYSTCEHHMLPFFGKATIWYIPTDKIIWISKIPRIIDMFARRLQNQERLTSSIADELMKILSPKWVWVIMNASHLCMLSRWVEKQSSTMTTSCLRWLFRNDQKTRAEFMQFQTR